MEKSLKRSVLVITERYDPEKFLVNDLVKDWVAAGHRVKVLTQVPSYPFDRIFKGYSNRYSRTTDGNLSVIRFKTVLGYRKNVIKKILNYFLFMCRVMWYALIEGRDVDNVFVYHTGPLTQALPVVPLKLFWQKKIVIWTQDVWPDAVFAYGFPDHGPFAVCLRAFVRLIYHNCDEVCVSSPGFVGRLAPYMPQSKVPIFIPQWVPDEFEEAEAHGLDLTGEQPRFIFTGNIGKLQNLRNMISAFGRLDPGEAWLFILGDGSARDELVLLAKKQGSGNIRFLGSLPPSRVKTCIQSCDFAVLSLASDRLIGLTIPAKFQAYLSAGRPILAVTDGEVASLVAKENLGVCADPSDIGSIVAAIRNAAGSSPEMRDEWSANMRRLLKAEYTKNRVVAALSEIAL